MKVITKVDGIDLLNMIVNDDLECGTMIRYKREDIILTSNPPQPVYEYYKYTAGDKKFHRCDENGKLGSKGQQRFINYSTLYKVFEIVEPYLQEDVEEDLNPLEDLIDESLFEDKDIEKLESYISFGWGGTCKDLDRAVLFSDFEKIGNKINELIDEVNKLKGKYE